MSSTEIYLRGDAWNAAGLPQVGPIDRAVVYAVAVCGQSRITSICESVWGGGNNRSSCQRILERMASYELVECRDGLWFSGRRAPKIGQPEEWQMPHKVVNATESGKRHEKWQTPQKVVSATKSGICHTPDGVVNATKSGKCHTSEEWQMPHKVVNATPETDEKSPRHSIERERADAQAQAGARTEAAAAVFLKEKKEKRQQRHPPSPFTAILEAAAKLPVDWSAWPLLDLVREIDTEEPPEDERDFQLWLEFAANCQTWTMTLASGPRRNPKGYRNKLVEMFRANLEEARDAMSMAISQALELKRQAEAEAEAEQKRAAIVEAAAAPALPATRDEADDPRIDPHAWLIGRGIAEGQRLTALLDSKDRELEDLRRQAETLRRQIETDWERATRGGVLVSPMVADHHRQGYLRRVARLLALAPRKTGAAA